MDGLTAGRIRINVGIKRTIKKNNFGDVQKSVLISMII
jgi:hypothetical protein